MVVVHVVICKERYDPGEVYGECGFYDESKAHEWAREQNEKPENSIVRYIVSPVDILDETTEG
jgi:hypothetical protein